MFFYFLLLKQTVLYGMLFFFANRAWNYYDRLSAEAAGHELVRKHALALVVFGLFCFLLGFAICAELR